MRPVSSRGLAPLLLSACFLLSCGSGGRGPTRVASPAVDDLARYQVEVSDEGGKLRVVARFPASASKRWGLEDGGERFASDLTLETPDGATKPVRLGQGGPIDTACTRGCILRYRYDLRAAAEAFADDGIAQRHGEVFVSPPSTWLIHPSDPAPGTRFRLEVQAPQGIELVSGLRAEGNGFGATWEDLSEPPYTAVGKLRRLHVTWPGAKGIDIALGGETSSEEQARIERWVGDAARNLDTFYGGYPTRGAQIIAIVGHGRGVHHGSAMGNGGASILVEVGRATTDEAFHDDWILTHEMFHLAFPGLSRDHHWAEEGMATYLEPMARARRGIVPVEGVWREWYTAMAQGEPHQGDGGLDDTASWGRTYWGGALFWLAADVEIRKRTDNRHGLPDVFRAIYQKGDIGVRWPMSRVVDEADRATGTDVVSKLYATHAHAAVPIDLDALFAQLGVSMVHGEMVFDDAAPLAAVRRAMVSRGQP